MAFVSVLGGLKTIVDGFNAVSTIVSEGARLIQDIRGNTNPIDYISEETFAKITHVNEIAQRAAAKMGMEFTPPNVSVPKDLTPWIKSIAPFFESAQEDWQSTLQAYNNLRLSNLAKTDALTSNENSDMVPLDYVKMNTRAESDDMVKASVDELANQLQGWSIQIPFRSTETLNAVQKIDNTTPMAAYLSKMVDHITILLSTLFSTLRPAKKIAPYNTTSPNVLQVWKWERQDIWNSVLSPANTGSATMLVGETGNTNLTLVFGASVATDGLKIGELQVGAVTPYLDANEPTTPRAARDRDWETW